MLVQKNTVGHSSTLNNDRKTRDAGSNTPPDSNVSNILSRGNTRENSATYPPPMSNFPSGEMNNNIAGPTSASSLDNFEAARQSSLKIQIESLVKQIGATEALDSARDILDSAREQIDSARNTRSMAKLNSGKLSFRKNSLPRLTDTNDKEPASDHQIIEINKPPTKGSDTNWETSAQEPLLGSGDKN